jgi:hypothetical protein
MQKFIFSDRYRLELHWKSTAYERDGVCKLSGVSFSGPALVEADKINSNDNIMLDFFHQYIILVENVYVAKLSWGEVIYNKNGTISLKKAFIIHSTELNKVPKLSDTDFLILDTSNHESETHQFNPLYKTYVVNTDTQLYKFGEK